MITEAQLTPAEFFVAAVHGIIRRLMAMKRKRPQPYGCPTIDLWGMEVESCGAELFAAKSLGLFWHASTLNLQALPGDCGNVQVRHTVRPDGCLILHDRDRGDARFILVTGRYPEYCMVGWTYARDGREKRYWRTIRKRSAYYCPQDKLRSMADWESDELR